MLLLKEIPTDPLLRRVTITLFGGIFALVIIIALLRDSMNHHPPALKTEKLVNGSLFAPCEHTLKWFVHNFTALDLPAKSDTLFVASEICNGMWNCIPNNPDAEPYVFAKAENEEVNTVLNIITACCQMITTTGSNNTADVSKCAPLHTLRFPD